MASTVTFVHKSVWGDQVVWYGTMTATDGTDEVATGMQYIYTAQVTPNAVTGNAPVCATINNTSNGGLALTTGISGGVYHIMVVGKA